MEEESSPTHETEEAPWEGLSPAALPLFYAQSVATMVGWIPLVLGGLVVATTMGFGFLNAALTAAAVYFLRFVVALWYPSLSWGRWGYQLGEHQLLIRHGVLFRHIVAIPASRIQHVDVAQGPIERWFGLASLHVFTASGGGADGVVPGLTLEVAESLRDRLVHTEGDGGV